MRRDVDLQGRDARDNDFIDYSVAPSIIMDYTKYIAINNFKVYFDFCIVRDQGWSNGMGALRVTYPSHDNVKVFRLS